MRLKMWTKKSNKDARKPRTKPKRTLEQGTCTYATTERIDNDRDDL